MILIIQWELILELTLLILLIAVVIVVSTILIVRNLRLSYKDLFRSQSKFDIELRKSGNLISKIVADPEFAQYETRIVKQMSFEEKKALLDLVDASFPKINTQDPKNKYVVETYENLQEIRRVLDAKVLSFNHKIFLFPFNIYAKLLKMKKMNHYTHQ